LERLVISGSLSITAVVPDGRFLLRARSNSVKTIIDPTTATEAVTEIRNTATINPLMIAIRLGSATNAGFVHSKAGLTDFRIGSDSQN
jgi:hypothetical protein